MLLVISEVRLLLRYSTHVLFHNLSRIFAGEPLPIPKGGIPKSLLGEGVESI